MQVHERGLARAGLAHHGHPLAPRWTSKETPSSARTSSLARPCRRGQVLDGDEGRLGHGLARLLLGRLASPETCRGRPCPAALRLLRLALSASLTGLPSASSRERSW